MQKDRRNTMIVSLLVIVVFMSFGYALLSIKVDNSGMSTSMIPSYKDVEITTISSILTEGDGMDVNSYISGKESINVTPSIQERGDRVIYVVNLRNNGNTDSKLKSIDVSGLDEHCKYEIKGIDAGIEVPAKDTMSFTFAIKYDDYALDKVNVEPKEITLKLDFEK